MALTKARVVAGWEMLNITDHDINPPDFHWLMLAEGDSWFSLGSILGNNLINQLHFQHGVLIAQTAMPGDTMEHMADWWSDATLSRLVKGPQAWAFNAVLLSGGGNDLIDAIDAKFAGQRLLKKFAATDAPPQTPEDCVQAGQWQRFEAYLRENFRLFSQLLTTSQRNKQTPVFVHTYDVPTPNHTPATPFGKAWLLPALEAHNIPPALYQPLTDHLFKKLGDVIRTLGLANFHVIDTAGTLVPADSGATGDSNDWLNEIHPNAGGYAKLAERWRQKIEAVLA
jgi:lysophospholipase L1-like esterase